MVRKETRKGKRRRSGIKGDSSEGGGRHACKHVAVGTDLERKEREVANKHERDSEQQKGRGGFQTSERGDFGL